MGKLTEAQRTALGMMPVYSGKEVSERRLRADGVGQATLWSLEAADLLSATSYANGRFWRITDAGRAALDSHNE